MHIIGPIRHQHTFAWCFPPFADGPHLSREPQQILSSGWAEGPLVCQHLLASLGLFIIISPSYSLSTKSTKLLTLTYLITLINLTLISLSPDSELKPQNGRYCLLWVWGSGFPPAECLLFIWLRGAGFRWLGGIRPLRLQSSFHNANILKLSNQERAGFYARLQIGSLRCVTAKCQDWIMSALVRIAS